jgi:hypothetical protein
MNLNLHLADLNGQSLVGKKVLFTPLYIPAQSSSYLSGADTYQFSSSATGYITASIIANTYKVDIANPKPETSCYIVATEDGITLASGSVVTGSASRINFNLIDLVKNPFNVRAVKLTPYRNYPFIFSGSLITLQSTSSLTDATGSVSFATVIPGPYQVDCDNRVDATFYISVPAFGSEWNAKDLLIVQPTKGVKVKLSNADTSHVLTVSSSDARYLTANQTSSMTVGTASIATSAISASYALSASWAPGASTSNSASWASSSISSSHSLTSDTALNANTATSATSASYALSASWAPGSVGSSVSASWASRSLNTISASYAEQASFTTASYISGTIEFINVTEGRFPFWQSNTLSTSSFLYQSQSKVYSSAEIVATASYATRAATASVATVASSAGTSDTSSVALWAFNLYPTSNDITLLEQGINAVDVTKVVDGDNFQGIIALGGNGGWNNKGKVTFNTVTLGSADEYASLVFEYPNLRLSSSFGVQIIAGTTLELSASSIIAGAEIQGTVTLAKTASYYALPQLSIPIAVQSAKFPLSSSARMDASQNAWRLLYDSVTPQSASWQLMVPRNYAGKPTASLVFSMDDDQLGTTAVAWRISTWNPPASGDYNLITASVVVSTASLSNDQVNGQLTYVDVPLNTSAITASNFMWINIERMASATVDDAEGNAELLAIQFNYNA